MRRWIDHLVTHPGAYADFEDYIAEIEINLNKRLLKAVKEDDIPQAKVLSAELTAYQNIAKRIKTCARERNSQITYQETINQ